MIAQSIAQSTRARIRPHDPNNSDDYPVSVSARLGRLQFHASGKFRVLQLADIQDGPVPAKDTIRLIEAALDASRPDLVILTGDQIAGYDPAFSKTFRKRRWDTTWDGVTAAGRSVGAMVGSALQSITSAPQIPQADEQAARKRDLEQTRDLVRRSLSAVLQPMIDRGIPFAVTYGVHDFQCGLSNAELDAIYREFPGCLNPESTAANPAVARRQPGSGLPDQPVHACEPGTFALPVRDVDGGHVALGLAVVDSGDYAQEGGYGSPSEAALNFLRQVPTLVGARSLVFQHTPLPQFYDLLKPVSSTTAYAIQGYRAFDQQCYVLDESKTRPGSYLGEGVSCPDKDSGEFDILRAGDYIGLFAGQDHRNGFVGTVDGLLLGATPTCGFHAYGPAPERRAARLIEFDIRHPYEPRTQLLEFGSLVGKPSGNKAYTFALSHVPTSAGDAVNLLRRPGLLATAAATVAGVAAAMTAFRPKRR
ncbi:metallophosphoesterase family protein [Bifidobacterium vespertilionis]|uniref:Serine/threonine protein phosphatase n=1 Tax=Bifidobacterium vespertilionis TaxID=2562524 RepID=A0A5J5DZM5_9BIFI|nr:metallophosphoesterase [Bifidobacterium vespertilionis]KAA8820806.1 serine/threonine protein phosphatase [Bifidobacterium vespertilionis]KAA8822275.1 serine/threonine protein phosphatase [Bifidobacterium vespertilionis]